MENKKCIIRNERFTYVLEVDGREISFTGCENADYFESIYEKLGYEVKRIIIE